MTLCTFSRRIAFALVFIVIVASCGGSEEAAEPSTVDDADTTADTTAESTTPEVDDRTDDEKAIDQLDLMLFQLRVDDLVATADCVVDRLRSEGIDLAEQGPQMIAALRCDPATGTQLFAGVSAGMPGDTGVCVVERLTEEAANVPLDEADTFFSAPTPPDAVLQSIADTCDVSLDDLELLFG